MARLFGPMTRIARAILGTEPDPTVPDIEPPRTAVNVSPAPSPLSGYWHGEKFPGGLGPVQLLQWDYWTVRQRSGELFKTNIYARGLIRRLVTNVINTGLHVESTPSESLLGFEEEFLSDWAELIEQRFEVWADNKRLCDARGLMTFGELQAEVFRESWVNGDILVTLLQDPVTKLPQIKLIDGGSIQTPLDRLFNAPGGSKISEGVEVDKSGRHVAYHVRQEDGTSKRIPTRDSRGRAVAWLVIVNDKRHAETRGEPILSLVLQSLQEIDRYRDSVQRKALIASYLAVYITRDTDATQGRSFGSLGGVAQSTDTVTDPTGAQRTFRTSQHIPGLINEQLKPGEEVKGFPSSATDEKFGEFEEAIIQAVAWANQIPPEILRLAFSHNYSASQAANNEFNLYLHLARRCAAVQLCEPVYQEWLISEALLQKFLFFQNILDAWMTPEAYDLWGAWIKSDWSGQIKPASDLLKVTNAHAIANEEGFGLRSRSMRELTGMKYAPTMKRQRRENELLAWAREPLVELERQPQAQPAVQSEQDGDGGQETNTRMRRELTALRLELDELREQVEAKSVAA